MRKVILFILAIYPLQLFAQAPHFPVGKIEFKSTISIEAPIYNIQGQLGLINSPAQAYLMYNADGKDVVDSVGITNGSFKFTGIINDTTLARLVIDYSGKGIKTLNGVPDMLMLYLEGGNITVLSQDSLSKAKLGGTKDNDDYMHFLTMVRPTVRATNALMAEYFAAPADKKSSMEFIGDIQKKQQAFQQQINDINDKFIVANPDASISMQLLIDKLNAVGYPDVPAIQSQFSKLSDRVRNSKIGVAFKKQLDALKAVAVGAIAPDFEQPDTNGTPVKLSSFKGKYVLLDFWASWCGPCRAESPNVVKAYNNFKGKNFTILSVSLDQPGKKDDWLKAIHTDGLNWNHVSDLKSWGNAVAVLYGVRDIPQNLLINPDGKIIAKNIFGDDLQKKLEEILRKE